MIINQECCIFRISGIRKETNDACEPGLCEQFAVVVDDSGGGKKKNRSCLKEEWLATKTS